MDWCKRRRVFVRCNMLSNLNRVDYFVSSTVYKFVALILWSGLNDYQFLIHIFLCVFLCDINLNENDTLPSLFRKISANCYWRMCVCVCGRGGSIDLSVLCAVLVMSVQKLREIFIHLELGFWCVFFVLIYIHSRILSVYLEMLGDLRLFQKKQKTNTLMEKWVKKVKKKEEIKQTECTRVEKIEKKNGVRKKTKWQSYYLYGGFFIIVFASYFVFLIVLFCIQLFNHRCQCEWMKMYYITLSEWMYETKSDLFIQIDCVLL